MAHFCLIRIISDSMIGAPFGSILKTIDPYILYDMRRAQFLSVRMIEDGFDPQWHLRAFESKDHGDVTALHLATEAG